MTFDFTNYMLEVAMSLKSIQHNPSSDEKRFVRISSIINMDELVQQINQVASPCLVAEDNRMGRLIEPGSSNYLNNQTFTFMVLVKTDILNMDSRQAAIDSTWVQVLKILSKMKRDYHRDLQGQTPRTGLRNLDWNSFNYQSVGPFGDSFVGTMVGFSLSESISAELVYNLADWADIMS